MRVFIQSIAAVILLTGTAAASEWCNQDRSRFKVTEHTICNTAELRALDDQNIAAFRAQLARHSRSQHNMLKARVGDWLAYRNACGADVACLRARYAGRIVELSGNLPALADAPARDIQEFWITQDGILVVVDNAGNVFRYNAETRDAILPAGAIGVTVSLFNVPALPSSYGPWVYTVGEYINVLANNILTPEELATLETQMVGDPWEDLNTRLWILSLVSDWGQ